MLDVGGQGRGGRQVHREVHAQGAVRLVPRHARQPAWRWPSSPRRCVEKFGDLKKPEAVVGTGPWMLDSYRPNVGLTLRAQPELLHRRACPTSTGSRPSVDEDNASRIAAFLSGKYDLGWEFPGTINRTDWVQIKDTLKQKRPNLQTRRVPLQRHEPHLDAHRPEAVQRRARAPGDVDGHRPPGHHRRHRPRASGAFNPPVPAGLKEWSMPVRPARRGREVLQARPRRGQAAAGGRRLPERLPGLDLLHDLRLPRSWSTPCSSCQKHLKDVGIDAKIDQKEYGAYIATCFYGKFDSMTFGPQTPFLEPDNFLFGQYYPGRAQEPEPHQRPGGGRHARPPAADLRRRQAARG